MNTAEIKNMSIEERLETMEQIWESLVENEQDIPSPEWHKELLDERVKKIEDGTAEFISLEELKAKRK